MSTLVSIGEFSRLTHLSVITLRHYHEVGVLEPADVDTQNGYRRYDIDQLPDAHVVRRLRDLEMPLEEVKLVLGTADERLRDATIAGHLQRMEQELARTQSVVASLRDLIEAPLRPFDVQRRRLETTHAAVQRAQVSGVDIEAWSIAAFADLTTRILSAGLTPLAPTGSIFDSDYFERGVGNVVAFIPISSPIDSSTLDAEALMIAGGEYAVALHRGSYEDLDRTYGALGSYVAEHGIGASGPITEHYLVGPEQAPDSADLRTEVCWPIRR